MEQMTELKSMHLAGTRDIKIIEREGTFFYVMVKRGTCVWVTYTIRGNLIDTWLIPMCIRCGIHVADNRVSGVGNGHGFGA